MGPGVIFGHCRYRGECRDFQGAGQKKKIGANNLYDIRVVGHFFREICPTRGTFNAKSEEA